MENILETKHIEKKYKKFKALDGINMHVPKKAIYGLVGKNGAGKTTLIRIICGLQNQQRELIPFIILLIQVTK